MGEKSQTLRIIELEEEIKRLQLSLDIRIGSCKLLSQQVDIWKAAADIASDSCRVPFEVMEQLTSENKRYREALEQGYDLTHAFDDQSDYAKALAEIFRVALEEK